MWNSRSRDRSQPSSSGGRGRGHSLGGRGRGGGGGGSGGSGGNGGYYASSGGGGRYDSHQNNRSDHWRSRDHEREGRRERGGGGGRGRSESWGGGGRGRDRDGDRRSDNRFSDRNRDSRESYGSRDSRYGQKSSRSDESKTDNSKRKLSSDNTESKKQKNAPRPLIQVPPLNSLLGDESEIPNFSFTQPLKEQVPSLEQDPRSKKCAISYPKDIKTHTLFSELANWKIDSSFIGCYCYICKLLNSEHKMLAKKLICLADQYFPPQIGAKSDCVPVIRIEDGNFEAIKSALKSQKAAGFKPGAEAVYLVGLTAHLAKVGAGLYWKEFDLFAKWLKDSSGGIAVPFICPVSKDLPKLTHINLHQGLTVMRARYVCQNSGTQVWQYSLWKPYWNLLNKAAEFETVVVPPVYIEAEDMPTRVVNCSTKVWIGMDGDFSKTVPKKIEKLFISELFKELRKAVPPSLNIGIPAQQSIICGTAEASWQPRGQDGSIPNMYMYGNSILRDTAPVLANLMEVELAGFDATLTSGGKPILEMLEYRPVPKLANSGDMVVLHFIGNVSLRSDTFFFSEGAWHYELPDILSDDLVDLVIEGIIRVSITIRKTFKGSIKLIGPMPRLLTRCCDDKKHALPRDIPFKSVLDYYKALNIFLAIHPKLQCYEVEFIPYQLIFDQFDESYLADGLHLTDERNDEFARFLFNLQDWKKITYKVLADADTPFHKWAKNSWKGSDVQWAIASRGDPDDDEEEDGDEGDGGDEGAGGGDAGGEGDDQMDAETSGSNAASGQSGLNPDNGGGGADDNGGTGGGEQEMVDLASGDDEENPTLSPRTQKLTEQQLDE